MRYPPVLDPAKVGTYPDAPANRLDIIRGKTTAKGT